MSTRMVRRPASTMFSRASKSAGRIMRRTASGPTTSISLSAEVEAHTDLPSPAASAFSRDCGLPGAQRRQQHWHEPDEQGGHPKHTRYRPLEECEEASIRLDHGRHEVLLEHRPENDAQDAGSN